MAIKDKTERLTEELLSKIQLDRAAEMAYQKHLEANPPAPKEIPPPPK